MDRGPVHDAPARSRDAPAGSAPRRRTSSLDQTLVRLVLFAVLPLLVATAALVAKVWWDERRTLEATLSQAAAALSLAVDRELSAGRTLLGTLASSPLIDDRDWRRFHAFARDSVAVQPGAWLILLDANLKPIFSTALPYGEPVPDTRELAAEREDAPRAADLPHGSLEYAREALATGQPVISDLFQGLLAGKPLVGLDLPVVRDGQPKYVLSLRFPPAALDAVLRAPEHAPNADAALVDRRGFYISQRHRPTTLPAELAPEDLRRAIANGEFGLAEAESGNGEPILRASHRSDLSGWTSVVSLRKRDAAATIRDPVLLWSAVTALMVLLGLFGAQRVARRLSRPISTLASNAAAVHRGEPPPGSRSSIREIEQLSAALVEAARSERRYDELRRLQEWSEAAQRAGGVGFFDYDFPTDRVVRTEGIARLTDWPEAEGIGTGNAWLARIVPDDASSRAEKLRQCIRARETVFESEFRVMLPGGRTRRLVERGRLEYGADGRARRMVGVNMDVTDLRRAQEERAQIDARFRAFMDNSPFKAWIKDADGRYLFLNETALRYKAQRDYVGTTSADHFDTDAAAEMSRTDRIVLDTREPYHYFEQVVEGGELRDYLTVKFPIDGGERLLVGGVSVDVTEQRRAERALRRADEQKDRFLATLSHELRNPLAPIRNAVTILKAAEDDPSRVAWSCRIIERQVKHMVRLIDDLLDVSRITRDKLALRRERVALASVIDAAVESVRPAIAQRGQSLSVEETPEQVMLEADATRLAQVVANLLGNASKYTGAGGRIELTTAARPHDVAIRVRDTGIGIAREHLPHVFDMFYQVPDAEAGVQGGLGIGLALVRELVRLHGGRVWAESDGPGRGATFNVVLPRDVRAAGDVRDAAAADSLARVGLRRVLVADDNRDAADSLASVLALMGCDVQTVYDGAAAVAQADRCPPEVAILDIGMPVMNGYQAAQAIRARHPGTTLIALTGWGQQADREQAAAAGFDHHFTKPVDAEALGALLDELLSARSADAGRRASG